MAVQLRGDNFKILQLTDLHFGELPHNKEDQQTLALIKEKTAEVQPDLIVVTGDLMWSADTKHSDKTFEALISFFNGLETPITITYGNHDTEASVSRSDLRKLEEGLVNPVEKKQSFIVEDRESYCIEIRDGEDKLCHVLYVIDSGAEDPLQIGTYEFVHPKQVNWFYETAENYRTEQPDREDFVFLHIPIPEYEEAWQKGRAVGYKYEGVCSPAVNTGLFTSMLLDKQVKGIFCGHDHDNDYEADYHGIKFCFGRVTGFNCYGELSRGGRVIELQANQSFRTYLV
ncbi:metallophosphoesterase family protein [Gracilibacillus alcaliphilus]|uniref:metallophosphoesterase family protein n=1 Tax=Gracilibacillus alcaliphilus TaxID=1401441 RepID=UPI00195BA30B|nr:metallophosphoesterase family protein [Gracilibacillus alcaliphilus]MBM7679457.1 calcineurin-like phosphoesterase family protein [Gracilibacillus alcaliphilus]